MRKFFAIVLCFALCLALSGCTPRGEGEQENGGPTTDGAAVETAALPPSTLYTGAKMTANGKEVSLYNVKLNTSQVWSADAKQRIDSSAALLRFSGRAEIKLELLDGAQSVRILPAAHNVAASLSADGKSAEFTLEKPADYVIELGGMHTSVIHLFTGDKDEAPLSDEGYNILRFAPGLHVPGGGIIPANGIVKLQSKTMVVLSSGAVVRARFEAADADDIVVTGDGIVDGSAFERYNGASRAAFVPFDFQFCTGVRLKDFFVSDPAGWCINFYFTQNSVIDGIKIISSRSNGDGISLQSCKNIEVKNTFTRTWDDSLVVKNYPDWRSGKQGATENISFKKCVIITDLAQSMELGYETLGEVMREILFEDITVLYANHKPVISIHNGNNARIENVVYRNITVERAMMGGGDAGQNRQLIEISTAYSPTWSTNHGVTALGSIDGVSVENVLVLDGRSTIPIAVTGTFDAREGYKTEHYTDNVTLRDISIKGVVIGPDYGYITTNKYTRGFKVQRSGKPVTGARL